ncbi:hypothetical protein M1N60_02060, partial [Thermodesulfovibrionales bacterium]|nr:hypothetical protein [Thermodesulfovibrionales bacterium]
MSPSSTPIKGYTTLGITTLFGEEPIFLTVAIDLSTISATDDLTIVLGKHWPGIQIYYPPIKYNPLDGSYESMEQAKLRLQKHAYRTNAHTLLFDLEDGCKQKDMSRE